MLDDGILEDVKKSFEYHFKDTGYVDLYSYDYLFINGSFLREQLDEIKLSNTDYRINNPLFENCSVTFVLRNRTSKEILYYSTIYNLCKDHMENMFAWEECTHETHLKRVSFSQIFEFKFDQVLTIGYSSSIHEFDGKLQCAKLLLLSAKKIVDHCPGPVFIECTGLFSLNQSQRDQSYFDPISEGIEVQKMGVTKKPAIGAEKFAKTIGLKPIHYLNIRTLGRIYSSRI